MTTKDLEIQRLRSKVEFLEKELQKIVESGRMCRYCKYLDGDCSPTDYECTPVWDGKIHKGEKK